MVKVRLSGESADIDASVAALLSSGQIAQLDRSAPYPNRRDPGVRVYLTVLISHASPTGVTR